MWKQKKTYWLLLIGNSTLLLLVSSIVLASEKVVVIPLNSFFVIPINAQNEVPTVTSLTGRVWMDRNLGASRVAKNLIDDEAYGDLYQWGRLADGHEKLTSGVTTNLSMGDIPGHSNFIKAPSDPYDWRSTKNDNLWQSMNEINNPCPDGFRLPTSAEFQTEINSWSSKDPAGAFASPLKLVLAGYRNYSSGSIDSQGSYGYYWTSTVDNSFAKNLLLGDDFISSGAYINSYRRAAGYSVRCIKN
ncbi:hypothetical protein [Candidatus Electrothrix sp.]|uniref:hypothetical protein n=1 Tax=Candidatus Electrothrix sp. TaxID=2170559 RepID=UPI004057A815